jgi:hypothetical protein
MTGGAPPLYRVERDGVAWLARSAWPDPAARITAGR